MKLVLGMMILGAVLVSCKTNADSHDHTYSEEWSSDETGHWYECTGCTEIKDKTAHTWNDGEVTKNPTVAEAGTKTFTCTVCGKTRNEDEKVVLTGITVTSKPSKILYKKNESFDSTGLTVTAAYTYGQSKILSVSDYTISGFDSSEEAKVNTVTISYVDAGVTKTADFTVYIQKEMTVTAFLTELKETQVEIITAIAGVPGISKSEDGKTANVFGVSISGEFQGPYTTFSTCLKTADLRGLDTSGVTSMKGMFSDFINLTALDLSSFDTSNVTSMNQMFYNCNKLASLDLSSFDTSSATSMIQMFYGCSGLTSITFGENFNTSSVTSMHSMFEECSLLTSITFGENFNTSSVTDMSSMFYNCNNLTALDLSSFDTSSVTSMGGMFYGCSLLTSITFGENFNTSSVKYMSSMFENCEKLENLNLSGFNTSNVEMMENMFINCKSLETLDLRSFNTSKVIDFSSMFQGCEKLTSLDLSSFDTKNVYYPTAMFSLCGKDVPLIVKIDSSIWDLGINLKKF